MDTERMINELKNVAEKHRNKRVFAGETNIASMCADVIPKLEELKKYEDTDITPDQLKIINEEYSRMAKELAMLQ